MQGAFLVVEPLSSNARLTAASGLLGGCMKVLSGLEAEVWNPRSRFIPSDLHQQLSNLQIQPIDKNGGFCFARGLRLLKH